MSHLSQETVAAYVDGTLSTEERRSADTHLSECASCRTEIRDVRRLLNAGRSRWAPRTVVGSTLAAAAVAALLLWPGSDPSTAARSGGSADSPLRSIPSTDAGLVVIEPLAPRWSGGDPTAASLRWRSAEGASTYRVTLTDEGGSTLWSTETTDSVVAIPDGHLEAGATYFWFVDATLADGGSASTGVRTLIVP